jgi:hypothetical protein
MKTRLLVAVMALVALALLAPALAAAAPGDRATGDAYYAEPQWGDVVHIVFDVQQVDAACAGTGYIHYSDSYGFTFDIAVSRVNVRGKTACFSGPNTYSSAQWMNWAWWFCTVQDKGIGADKAIGYSYKRQEGIAKVLAGDTTVTTVEGDVFGMQPLTGGNIVVR